MASARPAVVQTQLQGVCVWGPVPGDAVFRHALEGRYDGVRSLYHDHGHVVATTLDFHGTISPTMRLKFLRTSLDRGTTFNIAVQGTAETRGMVEAMRAAARYARCPCGSGVLAWCEKRVGNAYSLSMN